MKPQDLWLFLPFGYILTTLVETPILLAGLSPVHSIRRRLFAGIWLNACSYPIVILVLPVLMASAARGVYLLAAEIFAPVAECALFWLAFGGHDYNGSRFMWRDFATITLANLASFGAGEILNSYGWFGLFG